MPTAKILLTDNGSAAIPPWVVDFPSFCRWVTSNEFPDDGRIEFVNGQIRADMTMQQVYSHLRIKSELNMVIGALAKELDIGLFLPDGLRFTNNRAELSTVPDGTVLTFDSILAKKVKLIEGREGGFVAAEGSPDLVIEVVSDSSEDKDTEWLMGAYWEAGVREYWLIDARRTPLRFDIQKTGAKGFTTVRKSAGWIKSAVLGKAFRFRAAKNALGHPDFTLEFR